MAEKKPGKFDDAQLRRLAEKRLDKSMETLPATAVEAERLLQELEIHRIELEMQNAELCKARDDVETALEKYTELYDFAPVGYVTLDGKGNICGVNITCSRLLGVNRFGLIGQRLEAFVAEGSRAVFSALLARVFAGPGQASCEIELTTGAKTRLFVQVEAVTSGEQWHIALIDITQRREAEAALRIEQEGAKTLRREKAAALEALEKEKSAAEALEKEQEAAEALRVEQEANVALRLAKEAAEATARTKSQFLANMSHELRTPMTGILGMLQLALEEEIPAVPRRYLETTLSSAGSLLRILNDVLDMSKLDAGKLTIEQQPFSLRSCIGEAADLFTPELLRKRLFFASSVGDEVPDLVLGDQLRLRQILINLIGNAVKFTEKGKVFLRLSAQRCAGTGQHDFTFSVTDTGIGIPDSMKGVLFQAFSQVDSSHSRSFGGTGLGLAISREILALMGGTISFESEEGAGSTFSFTITLAQAGERDAMPQGEPRPAQTPCLTPSEERPRHLLLAEDDATISQILGVLLRRENYQVDFAENGLRAMEMWQRGQYDLVLMDVQMPLLNGFEATRAIREQEGKLGFHTPIIAMTAHAQQEDEQRCLDAGMDAYISKPIDLERTLRVIESMLRQSSGSAQDAAGKAGKARL